MPSLEELFKYARDRDFMRGTMALILRKIIDAEVTAKIGAEKYQRTDDRNNQRNGNRTRPYDIRLGSIELKVPKLRHGSYFPSFLEPRRLWEQALVNVVQEAYVHGVSTRKVDDLVEALGINGIDKSAVSRISKELDELVNRELKRQYPYVWLDATFPKVREGGHVQNMALVITVGVNENSEREILGLNRHE